MLARAIEIAVEEQRGQTDRSGATYILHSLRVMFARLTEEEQIVGVLNDVVEDAPDWTIARLRQEGFSPRVLAALLAVTKAEGEDYFDVVGRAAADPLARCVKRADLIDKLNPARLGRIGTEEAARLDRYRRALALIDAMPG
jgi:(p)ppGpp synthase/HD superfamily hydrolase